MGILIHTPRSKISHLAQLIVSTQKQYFFRFAITQKKKELLWRLHTKKQMSMADIIFTGASTAASLFLALRYNNDTRRKGPVPVHFNWYGNADQTVSNSTLGIAIYPLLIGTILYYPLSRSANSSGSEESRGARILADNAAELQRFGAVGKWVRSNVMPRLDGRFFVRSAVVLLLYLQQQAYRISLGEVDKVSTAAVWSLPLCYLGSLGLHFAFGTSLAAVA